jgi:MarR family transcriptional regulator for hemolysin
MTQREVEKGVGYWVLSAANLLERAANEELAPHGITYRQVQVLGTLACLGEMSQTDLANRIQVEPSTIVRIVDRRERDGWIERFPSPTDRRVKLLRTTNKVEPVWKTIQKVGDKIRERITQDLSERQVSQLLKSLETMCANLGGDA